MNMKEQGAGAGAQLPPGSPPLETGDGADDTGIFDGSKLRYATVVVHRDVTERVAVTVPYHEMPILSLVHGDSNVSVAEFLDVEPAMDFTGWDDQAEYERLLRKFGVHPEQKTPYVQLAYGMLQEGKFHRALNFPHKPLKEANLDLLSPEMQEAERSHAAQIRDMQARLAALSNRPDQKELDAANIVAERLRLAQEEQSRRHGDEVAALNERIRKLEQTPQP